MKTMEEKILGLIMGHEKNGNVYHARRDIIAWTQGRCPEITEDEVNLSLAHLSQEGYLVRMGNDYAITETRYAEDQAARLTAELIRHNAPPSEIDVAAAMTLAEEGLGFALSPGQSAAVRGAMTHRASIITGGPGTGKTTVLRALCDAFEAYSNESIQLLAPTGKAARRLSEQTGRPTMTVHALLRSLEQEDAGLGTGLMVIDEASMLSIPLFFEVLKALPRKMRLVLVGDPNQLPAVGPGQVLKDLLTSGLPVYRLTRNYRQGEHSVIRDNLSLILNGCSKLHYDRDNFLFLETSTIQDTESLALSIYLALRAEHGNGAQLLTPLGPAGGSCSAVQFNRLAQAHLNPPSAQKLEIKVGDTILRLGDRVIQTANNSSARNGDVGTIVGIIGDSSVTVQIQFDFAENNVVCYPVSMLGDGLLQLAYALTVHKAQGSEYDYVVIPLAKEHVFSWSVNMLYTAVSRARQRVVLVGSRWLLEQTLRAKLPPCRSDLANKIQRCLSNPAA